MTCREAMRTDFDFCVAEERLNDALEIMSATGGNLVPVVETREEMRYLGVITAREAAIRLGLRDLRPSEVMCRELADVRAGCAAPGDDATRSRESLGRQGASSLPVVEEGKLIGVLPAAGVAAQPADSGPTRR
ncbi:MAG: CBS domain-containing protein [Terriglobales bacterium]